MRFTSAEGSSAAEVHRDLWFHPSVGWDSTLRADANVSHSTVKNNKKNDDNKTFLTLFFCKYIK